jgi:hypothetical protein
VANELRVLQCADCQKNLHSLSFALHGPQQRETLERGERERQFGCRSIYLLPCHKLLAMAIRSTMEGQPMPKAKFTIWNYYLAYTVDALT